MQALKKHYEKFIFGILLVGFVGSGVYWLSYLRSVKSLAANGDLLKITAPNKPLSALDADDLQAMKYLDSDALDWGILGGKVTGSLYAGRDYMQCVNENCQRWIAFGIDKCPWCGTTEPPEEGTIVDPPPGDFVDTDKDGISDEIEMAYDFLKANRKADGWRDEDGDSFFNRTEFQYYYKQDNDYNGAAMADPRIHPPLAKHFRLAGVDRDLFSIRLDNVLAIEGQDKSKWDIALKVRDRGQWRSRFVKVGAVVNGYTIVDAEEKFEKVFDPDMNDEVSRNVSTVTLQKGDEEPMVLTRREVKYTGVVARLVLETSVRGTRALGAVRDGDLLRVKDSAGQVETYRIQIGDREMNAVLLVDGQPAGTYPINRSKKITIPPDVLMPSGMNEPEFEGFPNPGREPEFYFNP